VIAERYNADMEGTDMNVGENDWVTHLENPEQLKNLLVRLLNKTLS
jgi:hypothetical protein